MAKTFEIIYDITIDALRGIAYFIEKNLVNFANALNLILPYIMYFIGITAGKNNIYICWELCLPLVFAVVVYYLRSIANRIGKGITVPIPDERFTEVDDDGEVSIKNDRIQELLLYTADLEDWLERKGLL